jgi:hypothetical protein
VTSIGAASTPALVRALYQAYQERTWDLASTYLHPEAVVDMPATLERLQGRDAVIEWQRSYPEPWGTLIVVQALGDDEAAAAEINVIEEGAARQAMAAFWRRRDGLLHQGLELWITIGGTSPPPTRADHPTTQAALRAARATSSSGHDAPAPPS